MGKIQLSARQIALGVGLVAVIVLAFAFSGREAPPAGAPSDGTSPVVTAPTGPTAPSTPTAKPPAAVKPPAPTAQSGIKVLAPAAGDVLAINQLHAVIWNREPGETGAVTLVNANTNQVLGWVLANFTAKQLSFSWDTRDVLLSRTAGVKENLKPGSYRLRMTFDAKYAPLDSGVFTVVGEGQSESVTPVVRLKDEKVTPSPLTVSRGTKVIFVNNDAASHNITSATITAFTLAASGGAYTLDTSALSMGTHYYTSNIYSFRAPGTLTIK